MPQMMYQCYVFIAFQIRWDCSDESEWPEKIKLLRSEIGGECATIKRIFVGVRTADKSCAQQAPGQGRLRKLKNDNPGLVAAALAVNMGVTPSLAAMNCHHKNAELGLKDDKGDPLTFDCLQKCTSQHHHSLHGHG